MRLFVFSITAFLAALFFVPFAQAAESAFLPAKPAHIDQATRVPQWERIIDSYNRNESAYARCLAAPSLCPSERLKVWSEFISAIQDEPQNIQAAYVNGWFNRMPYREDDWIYGRADHWADLEQFLQYSGDCEDFSVAKYITLRALGFSIEQLKVTMVYDVYSGTDHAFLVARIGTQEFVLDNRDAAMEPGKFVTRYQPHYAFNEKEVLFYKRPVMASKIRKDSPDVMPGNR